MVSFSPPASPYTRPSSDFAAASAIVVSMSPRQNLARQRTVSLPEEKVNDKPNEQPDEKSNPRQQRQAHHQDQATAYRERGHQRDERHTETARPFGLFPAEHNHTRRDQNEREQRT